MSPIQRFTRDGVSRYVWAGMALAAIIGLVFALIMGAQVLDEQRAASEARAVRYVDRVLAPRLDSVDLTQPITGESADSLQAYVGLLILTDDRVDRVRIWSSADKGKLLFSTDRNDPIDIGSAASFNDTVLIAAAREGPISPSGFSDTGGDLERSLFRTYAPLQADAVAEIDQTDEGTIAPVRSEWLSYQILAGALVLLFLFMSALSLRDPIQLINVGVAPAASIPAGFSLIDNDRLHAVREVYRLSAERVKRLQEKLSESEEARRRLEGDIQRALVLAESSVTRPAAPAPPAVPSSSDGEPAIVSVPESEVVDEIGDDRVPAAAGGRTGASGEQKPLPPTPKETPAATPKETPAGKEPRRTSKQQKARPKTPAASTGNTPDLETRDAKAHAAALENFLQLAETDRKPNDTVDQGAVRALSPAAARKKLLAERLKPPPQEASAGDPRTGTD